ncbi:unnamed protein product [Didymodactylos carnosus]|uniref:Uncharacterized protein n=1 Tax=Didymodactylos carnosus TaxID=1234261 RepID=A0A8S2SLH3_9BILA|nr:unnamed protein product [Didymodactylos carnosus]CAF4229199.1 unnamed protein product [Didymodactylos carnosus]
MTDAVAETTAELRVAGSRKSPSNLAGPSNIFINKINPETRLPLIKDVSDHQSGVSNGQSRSRSRSKTPITASPKSTRHSRVGNISRQASISSIFNMLKQRSTENFDYHPQVDNNDEDDEIINDNCLRRKSNDSVKYSSTKAQQKAIIVKNITGNNNDSGVDIRFSSSSGDTQKQQQQQQSLPTKLVEQIAKEKLNQGQLYQRRPNNIVKAPIKQKIDKLRRRSEEATQALNGMLSNTISTGLSIHTASPQSQQYYVATPSYQHSRKPTASRASPHHMNGTTNVRRVSSEAEIQQRLQALRLSTDSNLVTDINNLHASTYSRDARVSNSRRGDRSKSPFQLSQQQQSTSSSYKYYHQSHTNQNVQVRHPHPTERGYIQPPTTPNLLSVNNVSNEDGGHLKSAHSLKHYHSSHKEHKTTNNPNANSGNLYLAFIASRHLSTLEDTLFEFDIDHQKLLRIFTWLKNVEDYRHEQMDHDKLLIEQSERMLNEEENLSLYSEIQYAVDDLPANLTGKACEKIPTMKYED